MLAYQKWDFATWYVFYTMHNLYRQYTKYFCLWYIQSTVITVSALVLLFIVVVCTHSISSDYTQSTCSLYSLYFCSRYVHSVTTNKTRYFPVHELFLYLAFSLMSYLALPVQCSASNPVSPWFRGRRHDRQRRHNSIDLGSMTRVPGCLV